MEITGEQQAPPQDLTAVPSGGLRAAEHSDDTELFLQRLFRDGSSAQPQELTRRDGVASTLTDEHPSAFTDEVWQSCRDTLDSLSWVRLKSVPTL